VHGLRADAGQHGEVAGHHQPLDMMGIGQPLRLPDGSRQAGHVRLAGPVEFGQRPFSPKEVLLRILRHLQPVDAAHIFAPADDLAHETFDRIERRITRLIRRDGCIHALHGTQQLEVECRGEERVIEERLTIPHRILVAPEVRQTMLHEVAEGPQCLVARHGPAKTLERPGALREPTLDHLRCGSRQSVHPRLVGPPHVRR
jgi:hypothetical protein